jgi:hypothetical protein
MAPDIAAIWNFDPAAARVWTGGQPSAAQLAALAAAGVQAVLNLGLPDAPYALPEEAALCHSLSMRYLNLPIPFDAPEPAHYTAFEAALRSWEAEGLHSFVHCAANYRVSACLALYGRRHWGWSPEAAAACASRFREPDAVWARWMQEAEKSPGNVPE